MARHIPSKWSYIVKYIGGHRNITEECDVILRFTKSNMEIASLRKGKISLNYNESTLAIKPDNDLGRLVINYKNNYDSEGSIFLKLRKDRDKDIPEVYNIYRKFAAGQINEIPPECSKYFKLRFFK